MVRLALASLEIYLAPPNHLRFPNRQPADPCLRDRQNTPALRGCVFRIAVRTSRNSRHQAQRHELRPTNEVLQINLLFGNRWSNSR